MSIPIEGISRPNFQFALIDATVLNQGILANKQITDSEAGSIATDLLEKEYTASTEVLNQDTENAQNASKDKFAKFNQIYQNDSASCQTGQNNAKTAVDNIQTQVSQDGSNLANLVSLASTIISVGGFVANLVNTAYT